VGIEELPIEDLLATMRSGITEDVKILIENQNLEPKLEHLNKKLETRLEHLNQNLETRL
jgi:hypothetical protein